MSEEIVETFFNDERTRKVVVFRRADGSFGFEELRFAADEQVWIPSRCYTASFIATLSDAVREARGRVAWLSELEEEDV